MQELELTSYQVYDPENITALPFDWLPFDATHIHLVVALQSNVPIEKFQFHAELQIYSSFPGWRKFGKIDVIKLEDGKIIVEMAIPTNLQRDDFTYFRQYQNWSHTNRFKLTAKFDDLNFEFLAPFTQSLMPVKIKEWLVCDPDEPTPTTSSQIVKLGGRIKKLLIGFKFENTVFASLQCNLRIVKKHTSGTPAFTKDFTLYHSEGSILLDPLPSGIEIPVTVNTYNEYAIHLSVSSGNLSRAFSQSFSIQAFVPAGTIEVASLAFSRFPVFEFDNSPLTLSNGPDRIIASLKISTSGYVPGDDIGPAKAWINFFDDDNFYFRLDGDIRFLENGEAYAFLESIEIPPGSYTGRKKAHVYLNHNNRTYFKAIEELIFINERRADNIIQFLNVSTDGLIITPDDKILTVRYQFHGIEQDLWVNSTIILLSCQIDSFCRRTSYKSFAIAFTRVNCRGKGLGSGEVKVALPNLKPELFGRNHIAVLVQSNYSYDGLRYSRRDELNDLRVSGVSGKSIQEAMVNSGRRPPQPQPTPPYPKEKLSGIHWCAKFPTSTTTASLASPFKGNIQKFILMLEANKCDISIHATRRPEERAYLMCYAFKIANKLIKPGKVPRHSKIDIIWDHDNAIAAAAEMVAGYRIVYEPVLKSKHIDGLAIDMTIVDLPQTLKFKIDNKDIELKIGKDPAHLNVKLWALASKYYDVAKLPKDAPHWMHKG